MKKVLFNKKRRKEGRQYVVRKSSKIVAAKIGELCQCPTKCFEMRTARIFNGLWDISEIDRQNAYLFGCIEFVPVKQ